LSPASICSVSSILQVWDRLKAGLRVLQILAYYRPAHRYGGPVVSVHGLSRKLVELGVDVTVFTTNIDGPGDLDVPLGRAVCLDGVRVFYFPVERPRGFVRCPRLASTLVREVQKFDLVHIHGLYLYPTLIASRICHRKRVPYVIAPRGMLDPHAVAMKSTIKKRLYLWLVEKKNLEQAAALHFTSEAEQKLAAQMGVCRRGFVVSNALELAEVSVPVEDDGYERAERDPVVLFLGRMDRKKGLDLLIPAFAKVVSAEPAVKLVLAGPDNEGYLAVIKELVAKHDLENQVSYAGMLVGSEKLNALASARLLVLPSYSESFGMVVLEALASMTPVVISERVNIQQEIEDAGAGLVTACDTEAISDAVLQLLQDPERAHEMGRRGRELVRDKFNWDRAAQAMVVAYGQILAGVA
jgi:glycosyltransferase involved in cell wall biosynthesis